MTLRSLLLGLLLGLLGTTALAQQQPTSNPQQLPAQQGIAPQQPRAPFQVSPAHQGWLDQVLIKWENDSKTVKNFYCDFELDKHNIFGPADGRPFAKEKGKLGYTKPDKGSFQITESVVWKAKPQAAPAPVAGNGDQPQQPQAAAGDYVPRTDGNGKTIPGDHWVCTGQKVFQYKHEAKELEVVPIPQQMQGKEIVNGPLPFVFGAEAKKLKVRYWMEPAEDLCKGKFIGIHAKPKFQQDAAEFSDVWIVLRNEPNERLMPAGLRLRYPDGSWSEYRFDLKDAQVNGQLAGLLASLFAEPRTPWGWKRVERPLQQAQQPQPAAQR